MMVKSWKHQIKALEWVQSHTGSLLGMGMGTGKTKVVLDYITGENAVRSLVICPKSVINVWVDEYAKHCHQGTMVIPLTGTPRQKTNSLDIYLNTVYTPTLFIINYESFWRDPVYSQLLKVNWDVVVLDECHRIKSPNAKTSQRAYTLGKRAGMRIGLSGTVMADKLTDVYAQYKFLDDSVFGTRFDKFKQEYFEMGGVSGREILYCKKPNKFNRKLKEIGFFVDSKDVLDLPIAVHVERTTVLNSKAKKIYDKLRDEMIVEIDQGIVTVDNILTKSVRLQQITSGIIKQEDGTVIEIDTSKKELFEDVLEDFPINEPIVVFCKFHHDLDNTISVCKKKHRTYGELSGRANALAEWQDARTNTLICQIRSGAEGIDLTRARYAIYYSTGFSLGEYQQSCARINRPGQEHKVTYIHLVVTGTIDRSIRTALRNKGNVIDSVLREITCGGG